MKNIILNNEPSNYYIDSNGNVFGKRGFITPINWKRYLMYSFNHKGKKIRILAHRIVALYCLTDVPSNYSNLQVNHIDGNRFNNIPSNLEWCTQEYNIKHHYNKTTSKGTCFRKIKVKDSNGNFIGIFNSLNECSKKLNLNAGNLHSALKNKHKIVGLIVEEIN